MSAISEFVFEYNDRFGVTYQVMPNMNTYLNNDNLYLGLDFYDTDCQAWLPYADVTVNVGALPFLESAIDTNNNGNDILDFLVKNGFGELTGAAIKSGYCEFPVFKFNEDKLKEVDSFAFELYAKAHNKELCSLDNVIIEAKHKSDAEALGNQIRFKEVSLDDAR